jgi:type I restriction enzyme S subunit
MMRLVRIGDVCEVVSGATPRRDNPAYWNGTVPWVTPKELADLDGPTIGQTAEQITEAGFKSCSTRMLPPGAVLFSSRAPIGHVAIATISMCTNQGFKSLVPRSQVDSAYLYWVMKWSTPTIEARASGTTFKEVSKAEIEDAKIPLPPLPEQRRIAAILDEADALRRKRREALGLLDALLRSAFLEMFGDPVTNPRGWETVELRNVIVDSQYGTAEKANTDGVGLPVLRMNNLGYDGRWDLTDLKHCDIVAADLEKFTVQPGDLLFNRTNSPELVGKTGVWKLDQPFAFAGYLIRIRFDESRALPDYVSGYLNSAAGKRYLLERAKPSNNMSNFNATMFGEIPVLVPPLALQRKFVDLVGAVESERGRFRDGVGAVVALFEALLHGAFSGSL